MKNILKTILFAFAIIAFGACEHDPDPIVSANGFTVSTVETLSPVVFIPQDDANTAATLQWNKSDNGGFTSVSQYKIEVAESGTNFANAVTANSGNPTPEAATYALTVKELNGLINQLPGFQCGVPMEIDIRVKSTLGSGYYNEFVQYSSNAITMTITPYTVALPTLAFSATGANLDAAPKLASSGVLNLDYEGYMWLEPGSYKFYKPDACLSYASPTVYGDNDSGSFNTLVVDGSGYQVNTAGYFLVKANLSTNSYSVRPTTWNIYGGAKTIFPGANSAMVYDQVSGLWSLTINLGQGYGFKFRSNGNAIVLGAYNQASVNTSLFAGSDLSYLQLPLPATEPPYVSELKTDTTQPSPRVNKSYTVTLDLRSPRNYKYTVTANP